MKLIIQKSNKFIFQLKVTIIGNMNKIRLSYFNVPLPGIFLILDAKAQPTKITIYAHKSTFSNYPYRLSKFL